MVVAISVMKMSSKRFFCFSGLYFFHHFHHNRSRACQDEVAHCPVIHMENVEAVDRQNKLANLRRMESNKSYAFDLFLYGYLHRYTYWTCKTSRILHIISFSTFQKNTFLRINVSSKFSIKFFEIPLQLSNLWNFVFLHK